MPKSKKPPAQGPEAKPAAKPGASKAPPSPSKAPLAPAKAPLAPARAPLAPAMAKTAVVVAKPVGAKSGPLLGKNGPVAAKNGPVVLKNGPNAGKSEPGAAKSGNGAKVSVPSAKAPVGKNGPVAKSVPSSKVVPSGKVAKAAKAPKPVEVPQPKEPRKWPKGGPTKPELKHYRDRLLEMRRTLLSSSKELAAEALKSSGQDFSVDHMADNGSDNYEQDFSLKLLEGESEQLADIREALMKIDGKVETPFGICEACADEDQKLCETCPWIPPSRLEVLPHARLCVQTKEIEERRKQ